MSASRQDGLVAPWGEHALDPEGTLDLELGPLVLRARSRGDEVWLSYVPGDSPGAGGGRDRAAGPREDDWIRWPVPEDSDRIRLSPVFPPRPVVAEPELAFRLLPRGRARIFVRVPLWVRVDVVADGERTLTEVPSVVLSDTWWGGFTEGELCYWLPTTARRRVPREVIRPHMAVCPLELANGSDDELPVEKIVLRVAHLSVFSDEGRLWADETRVRYRGVDEGSDIDVTGNRPSETPGAVRVAGPRERPPARGFRALTFARLKALPGLAGF